MSEMGNDYDSVMQIDLQQTLSKMSHGREITDSEGNSTLIYIGSGCESAPETRHEYGYKQGDRTVYNAVINFIVDDYHDDIHSIEVRKRRNQQGQLISFMVDDEPHNAYVDATSDKVFLMNV
jgi:hypothetical protein